MAVSILEDNGLRGKRHGTDGLASSTLRLRIVLLGLCLAAAGGGAWLGSTAAVFTTEPDLARLLRAMGLIKAGMLAAAVAAVLWRFSWPTSSPVAAGYIGGAALAAGASALLLHLAWIPTAAVIFHAGAGLMILAAFFDETGRGRLQGAGREDPTHGHSLSR